MVRFLIVFLAVVCVLLDAHFGTFDCQMALFGLDDALVALIGSAVISGVGSAISSASASSSANKQSARILDAGIRQAEATEYSADKYYAGVNATNLMNARENALNRQFQWDMWNATNEYNDPSNEVKRLLAAGLNPALVKAGQPASMQSAPSSIAMQAPQQTSVPDYLTPAVNAAQVEQGGMQQAYGLRMQAFEQVSSSLVNAFNMAHQNKQFALQKKLGDQMLNVYDAQIKNLGASTSLMNEQEWNTWNDRMLRKLQDSRQALNDLFNRLETTSKIHLNEKTMQSLTYDMTVKWPQQLKVALMNAENGRISASAAYNKVMQDIREYNGFGIKGFDKFPAGTQRQIMDAIGSQLINSLEADSQSKGFETMSWRDFLEDGKSWTLGKTRSALDALNPLKGLVTFFK